jgi:superfamily II DNA or RNA helicase
MTSESLQTLQKLRTSLENATTKQWVPHEYQKISVLWLIKIPEAVLWLDPGLGKSVITLAAFKALKKQGSVTKLLIVAPLRVAKIVWSKDGEVGKWSEFSTLKVSLIHGDKKAREKAVEAEADIYVINYDGLAWLAESGLIKKLLKKKVDMLCFDEISKMKHSATRRFKSIKPHLGSFKRRIGLTGSPAANGLMDLFGQIYALDLGQRLGRYITHYRFTYFNPSGYGGYTWLPKAESEQAIKEKLSDLALSMRAEDYLELPPLIEENIWVDLPPKARKAYDDMEDELIMLLDSDEVTAANAAVASGKCRQIASGGAYLDKHDEEKRRSVKVHDAKTEALVDLVDELQGSPLLIAYEFHHDLERIREALGDIPA